MSDLDLRLEVPNVTNESAAEIARRVTDVVCDVLAGPDVTVKWRLTPSECYCGGPVPSAVCPRHGWGVRAA